jgi:hypothetical protein
MSDVLILSETMRFPFGRLRWQMRFLKAKIYIIDWAQRKVLNAIAAPEAYYPEEFASLKQSYHYHGARGITSSGRHIFVALQNRLLVYDHDLNCVKHVDDRYFNGLHELAWSSGSLYVTCAVTDAVIALDESGCVRERFCLGDNAFLTGTFGLAPRTLDNRLDYRVMHKSERLYHVNSVQATKDGVYAGLNHQGAFVRIHPREEVLIADPALAGCHNARFSPDGNYILINDTGHYSLQVFDRDCRHLRAIDLRLLGLPIDFSTGTIFGDGHAIKAGWLRGMDFSAAEKGVVFLGLSPTMVVAVNFLTGGLVDYLKLRENIWVSVHGLHNLSLTRTA